MSVKLRQVQRLRAYVNSHTEPVAKTDLFIYSPDLEDARKLGGTPEGDLAFSQKCATVAAKVQTWLCEKAKLTPESQVRLRDSTEHVSLNDFILEHVRTPLLLDTASQAIQLPAAGAGANVPLNTAVLHLVTKKKAGKPKKAKAVRQPEPANSTAQKQTLVRSNSVAVNTARPTEACS